VTITTDTPLTPTGPDATTRLLEDWSLAPVPSARWLRSRAARIRNLRAQLDTAGAERYGWVTVAGTAAGVDPGRLARFDPTAPALDTPADPTDILPSPLLVPPVTAAAVVPGTDVTVEVTSDPAGYEFARTVVAARSNPVVTFGGRTYPSEVFVDSVAARITAACGPGSGSARTHTERGGSRPTGGAASLAEVPQAPVFDRNGSLGNVDGTVLLVDRATIRVARAGAYPQRWEEFLDALSHVTLDADDDHVTLPAATPASWLWWFARPGAGTWVWDVRSAAHVAGHDLGAATFDAAVAAGPETQAVWPGDIDLATLGVRRVLTGPQRRDVARMLALGGGANFSVPGAGKTTMAYVCWAIMRFRSDVDRAVVVAPLSAHEAWENEPADVFDPLHAPAVETLLRVPHGDVMVVNYERLESADTLERLRAWCSAGRALVVFDEAHRVKAGRAGVRGAAAIALGEVAARRIVLTGTPRPNGQSDLVNVLDLAYPGRGARLVAGGSRHLRSAYCRVTKAELGLPPLRAAIERVPMSPAHDRIYDAMVDSAAREFLRDPELAKDFRRAGRVVMLLLQAATDPSAVVGPGGHLAMAGDRNDLDLGDLVAQLPAAFVPTKMVRVAQLVDAFSAAGEKVVVWACFRHHVEQLRRILAPHQPGYVDGSVPQTDPGAPTDRHRELARFRTDPDCTVLIATPHTLAEGVSLHHTTTHQIHLDRTFNAGLFLQSLDRTHRLGLPADADCTVTYLVAQRSNGDDTIDALVGSRLEAKVSAMGRILDDPGLEDLALPSLDDTLGATDVLLGDTGAADLAALFAHLVGARR
jgi:hypothetical protein